MQRTISIKGARLHNLKNISVDIPKNQLVVLTGLSGSGKSTLAFDILHKESQRQYMESLGMVTYLNKPPLDSISGLSPSISIDQLLTNRSPRSTVGTASEVYTYLRVLYARIGYRRCPACGAQVPPDYNSNGSEMWDDDPNGETDAVEMDSGARTPCPRCQSAVAEMGMANFSFNTLLGACPTCTGIGFVRTGNLERLIDPQRSIPDGGVLIWDKYNIKHYSQVLENSGLYYEFPVDLSQPIGEFDDTLRDLLLYGTGSPQFKRRFPGSAAPKTVGKGRFEGIVTNILRKHSERANDPRYRGNIEKLLHKQVCPDCNGERLNYASRQVTINARNIVQLANIPLGELAHWLQQLPQVLSPEAQPIYEPILSDLQERLRRLLDVGVGYLTLARSTPSLSAGEAQRLRLASLLGSGLTCMLYVLDEPTIGLHPRDSAQLIKVLRQLRDLGNTVLVIEHDLEVVAAADHIIDMGPGAGVLGGEVIAEGSLAEIKENPNSITGDYLSGRKSIPLPQKQRCNNHQYLTVRGARAHNLKNIDVAFPLGKLSAVAGVSGSGKSSLLLDTLARAAQQHYHAAGEAPGDHDGIDGWQHLDKAIIIDQKAIGRTPRSNAATYTEVFTAIRQAFAGSDEARERRLTARHFSFNVNDGRCERCHGAGFLSINMHFLPDVQVRCPVCHGKRFKREVLAARYHGRNIADVLDMTMSEALAFFANAPAIAARLQLLDDVGLGYLKLGQPATTLSGGEAQRIKLAKELSRKSTGRTLYLLDEPTTGLHVADIARLLNVLNRLVDAGNTAIVIEHNLHVIQSADWIIELGPGGGEAGGYLITQGTPEQIRQTESSPTGRFMRNH